MSLGKLKKVHKKWMKEHAVVDDAGEGSKEDTEDAGQSEEASEESDEDKSKQSSGEDEASDELESSVPGAVPKQEPGASEEDDPFFNPVPNAKSAPSAAKASSVAKPARVVSKELSPSSAAVPKAKSPRDAAVGEAAPLAEPRRSGSKKKRRKSQMRAEDAIGPHGKKLRLALRGPTRALMLDVVLRIH